MKRTFVCEVQAGRRKTQAEFVVIKGQGVSLLGKETAIKLGVLVIGVGVSVVNGHNQTPQQQYPEVFNRIGKMKNRQITLDINPQVRPVAQPCRRVPFNPS